MTERPPDEDIWRAVRLLVVSILRSPTLDLVLGAGVVSVVAHVFYTATGKDPLFLPLMFVVAAIDFVVGLIILRDMYRRLRWG